MSKLIKKRWTETITESFRDYQRDGETSGWSFPCDRNGNVDVSGLAAEGLASYRMCLRGFEPGSPDCKIIDRGVRDFSHRIRHPAIIQCDCGAEVALYGFTNTCDVCERDYNMGGQLLADRSRWGEETGESAQDIIDVDGPDPYGLAAYTDHDY